MAERRRSPIESMVDAVMVCVRCGARMGACSCWITLRCPQCGREKITARDDSDPVGTAVVVAHCDRCPGEDNGLVDYFDAGGNQIYPE